MANEFGRREFLKAAALGTAGAAAAGMFSGMAFAAEEQKNAGPAFEGKKKFAGVGCVRALSFLKMFIRFPEESPTIPMFFWMRKPFCLIR